MLGLLLDLGICLICFMILRFLGIGFVNWMGFCIERFFFDCGVLYDEFLKFVWIFLIILGVDKLLILFLNILLDMLFCFKEVCLFFLILELLRILCSWLFWGGVVLICKMGVECCFLVVGSFCFGDEGLMIFIFIMIFVFEIYG